MYAAWQRAHNAGVRPGLEPRRSESVAAVEVASTTLANRESKDAQPSSSSTDDGDTVPRVEEQEVMAAALMKPYHTICRKFSSASNGKRVVSASSASRTVDRLTYTEEVEDGGGETTAFTKPNSWAGSPYLKSVEFSNPLPGVSRVVAESYPAQWIPSITPCFDEGLLYRIEWRRQGHQKLPGETGGYAYVVWCFHNITACYEMEIEVTFEVPPGLMTAPIRGWGETKMSWTDVDTPDGSPTTEQSFLSAHALCPPLRTIGFVIGRAGAFQTSIRGIPVPAAQTAGKLLSTSNSDTKSDEVHRSLSSEESLRRALKEWRRFVDPEFPPNISSLQGRTPGLSSSSSSSAATASAATQTTVRWLRTSDIVARLFSPTCAHLVHMQPLLTPIIDPLSIEPGELGDSWLVGAMAAVAEHPGVLLRMFRHPRSSEHAKIERALGAFRVTLNVQGWWRSVVVDDLLPVTSGNYPQYAHSNRDVRELWMGMLEKAFAKVRGGYANIVAGDPLDALRVLTGWPCARYDIANFKGIAAASSAFASRLLGYDRHGLQIIFHTAPQLSAPTWERGYGGGAASLSDASLSLDDDDYRGSGGGNGLVPGMVYTVVKILQFSTSPFRAELTLLQVRNTWGDVAAWKGKWRCGSPRWAQWPRVAEACRMPLHTTHDLPEAWKEDTGKSEGDGVVSGSAAPTECACRREKYIWLEWSEVYRYFSGCGVMFRLALHHDYRVQGAFEGVRPSVCLRVTVTNGSFVGVTLSMQGTGRGKEGAPRMDNDVDDDGAASAHPPIMVSLAREQANALRIVRNSQLDPDNPTPLFTFMQVSEVSFLYLLTPEESPYWVIPRMLATDASTPLPGAATPAVRRPYVLGYFQKGAVGVRDGPRVEFVQLPATSPAFQNSTCFSLGDDVKPVSATFQVRPPQAGFPSTYVHTEVSEEAGIRAGDDFDTAAGYM
ncbi:putative mitochondrial calpain-like cysteine peptidase [Leptomonas pyrrhocoris]|uniref:Putative mitochondrial calpain-like cysteine peptidase n=1 Tax=Leptomonas pyrrhocoris TaxID=157538 RepID=A0A0M9FT03_LEPPY|nr:putative mitochondrial calpain-like cysteine peptidase [Leptomonas pyrrhocoris]KPA75256.1 putative mitochondrial calpain-like cysteine peptidase [Leptomonas pyrrhocoris]|eukprot:XP_015653695.1 putative mitochondrial calpain-like cysteine peptidase [Leptomonas pyrrhocoris]